MVKIHFVQLEIFNSYNYGSTLLDKSFKPMCLAVVYEYISDLIIVDCKNRPKPLYFI